MNLRDFLRNRRKNLRSVIIFSIGLFFLLKKLFIIHSDITYDGDSLQCIEDYSLEYTNYFYNILRTNYNFRIFIQSIISLVLDLNVLIISYLWILKAKNWRIAMTLILYFSFRELISHIFQLKLDEDFIYGYVGFPSLTINYHQNKTFFFSGTLGFYLIIAVEMKNFNFPKLSLLSYIFVFIYALFLLSTRAQYFIGIFCSLISAHYFHLISDKYNYIINDFYDFDKEANDKKKGIEFEKNMKVIIENTIKKNKSIQTKNLQYKRVSSNAPSNLEIST